MAVHAGVRRPRWYAVPARALFVTFLVTLLTFAVTLFGSILDGCDRSGRSGDTIPICALPTGILHLPVAVGVGAIGLLVSLVIEIRHYRQMKALDGIARLSR